MTASFTFLMLLLGIDTMRVIRLLLIARALMGFVWAEPGGQEPLKKREALLEKAELHEQKGELDEAIAACATYIATAHRPWRLNTQVMELWSRLLWQRNQPAGENKISDREGAYEGAKRWIQQTSRFVEKMSEEEQQAYRRLEAQVEQYGKELGKEPK
jgi:hypothetical protein